MRDRTIAFLLALFLGWFGAHKFYLNQPGWGVIYLLFSPTWIPFIVGLCEAFYYLWMPDHEFNQKYN